ncbi:MAG: thioredoxin family protein [Burkholderiales bacterium]
MLRSIALFFLMILGPGVQAQVASPYAIDIPKWFTETFLDFREDVRDAAKENKRLLVYFGQDGCPYCTELMQSSFTQPRIVDKTRKNFVAIALNVWGDREVTWVDGKTEREKDFAKRLKVQFTPTILLLDEKGGIAARMNGYYPPHRMEAALDFAAGRWEKKQNFADYMRTSVKEAASETLHDEAFFMKAPYALTRKVRGKPLAVIFESKFCSGCDALHREGFRRPEVVKQIARFDVARFALGERVELVRPDGKKTTADAWARDLKIAYTPSIVFFGDDGREAFRLESYVRPFHLAASFEYVASGAYRKEPSLQRFIQSKAEVMRAGGQPVELWK